MAEKSSPRSVLSVFPDRLSPVFVKELRQGLRANWFVWPFIAVQIFAIIAVGIEMALGFVGEDLGFTRGVFASGGVFFFILAIVFVVVMPLTLFGALQPEVKEGNVELLLMSDLSRWQIVLGKLIVGSVLSGLMMVSLLPYLLIRYFVGDVELVENATGIFYLMMLNLIINAIVLGASGFSNYVGRAFLIMFMLFSFLITATIAGVFFGSMGGNAVWVVLGLVAICLVFIALSLQLGRAKLRVYENPLDPPATALIIVMFVVAPIAAGMFVGVMAAAAAAAWAKWLANLLAIIIFCLLAFGIAMIDRGPGKKKSVRWAQP